MKNQQGQSLVEMIVVIGMVVLLATGVVAGTTISLSRSGASQIRTDALTVAQAGIELARGQRDNGWDAFALRGTPQSTYCVGSDGAFGQAQTSCTAVNVDNKYTRSVTLQMTTISGISTMKVTSSVTWGDTTNPLNKVELTTYLTQWR